MIPVPGHRHVTSGTRSSAALGARVYRGSGTRPLAEVNRYPLGGARSAIVLMACMIKVVQRPLVWERRLAAAVTFEPHFVKLHAPCVNSLSSVMSGIPEP